MAPPGDGHSPRDVKVSVGAKPLAGTKHAAPNRVHFLCPNGDRVTGNARLCQTCADEWVSWLHYRPHYVAEYTLTDKREDLMAINRERWRSTILAQQSMIARHCKEKH